MEIIVLTKAKKKIKKKIPSVDAQAQAPDDPLSFRAYIEKLWASFHAQDRQCDPYIFVEYFRHCRPVTTRLPTKQDSLYLSLQQVSQDRAQELFARHLTRPYQGVSRIEFFVCCLWIPVVRQGVVCFHSVGLGCSWIFTVIVFNDPCGSTQSVSMFISYFPRFFPSAICLSGTCGEFFI